jgi:hypothetical protein
MRPPYLWGVPLLLCFAATAAIVLALEAMEAGESLAAVAGAAVFLLCCWGVYTIFRCRAEQRWWR